MIGQRHTAIATSPLEFADSKQRVANADRRHYAGPGSGRA
jgi:hypothetical protein